MEVGVILSTLAGLGLLIALLAYNNPGLVFASFMSVGWGLLFVVVVRAGILVVAGVAWERLVEPFGAPSTRVFLRLRWIREAINVLLPVLQVGGDLMGGRLLTFWNVPGPQAGASILVDLIIQVGTQFVFTLVGFGVLALTVANSGVMHVVGSGLAVSAGALTGFYVFQRSGLMRLADGLLARAARRWPRLSFGGMAQLHARVQATYGQSRAVAASFVLHQIAWFMGVAEIWIALDSLSLSPAWSVCLVLESLGQAVRSADFATPGVMGVQEGGFLIIGGLYGIPPEVCLALSLVKRVPDLALGLPGLLSWMLLEARRPAKSAVVLPVDSAD